MQKWNVTCYILHIYRCIWHLQLSALRQVAGLWWWVRRTEAILAKFWPSKVHACPEYCRAILLRYSSVVFVWHCFTFALMTTEHLVKKHLNVLVGNGELSSIFNSWWLYQVRTRHSCVLRLPGRLCSCSSMPGGSSGRSGCHCVNLHLLIFFLKAENTNSNTEMWSS